MIGSRVVPAPGRPWITANQVTLARLIPMPLLSWLLYRGGEQGLQDNPYMWGALIAGTWIVYAQRPVLVVRAETNVSSLSADFISRTGLHLDDVAKFNATPYPIAVVTLPEDEDARQKERLRSFQAGGMSLRGDLFAPRNAQYLADMNRHSLDMNVIGSSDARSKSILDRFVATHGPGKKKRSMNLNDSSRKARTRILWRKV
jgi:hypothetical protein